MTTEVYRNMLYTGDEADLQEVFAVVFDEFHYMNDPDRGAWRGVACCVTCGDMGWWSSLSVERTLCASHGI